MPTSTLRIKVAITGTLSKPRKEIVRLMEDRSNAEFSPDVTYDTNYLVAARFDTNKAKRAAQIGVTVTSESEMMKFIGNGAFPENQTPVRPTHIPDFRTDEITWEEQFTPELCFLEYCDNEGQVTQRFVHLTCKGTGSNGHKYLGAYDSERFKTFRIDRILRIETLPPVNSPTADRSAVLKA